MTDIGAIGAAQDGERGWRTPAVLRRQGVFTLVLLGPTLAVLTSVALRSGEATAANIAFLRGVLLADLVYLLVLATLILWRIAGLVAARRRRRAGSQLHLRLTGVFALVALVPTVIVAVMATITVNYGIEGWFSDRIGSVVRNSLATAEAYEREHRKNITGDLLGMANILNRAGAAGIGTGQLNDLVRLQAAARDLPEAFVFSSEREILARGEFSYLFTFEPPTEDQLARARAGEVVIMEDEDNNELRALVYLTNFFDSFLYVSREVQGEVLRLLDETRGTVQLYERLERERDQLLFNYALIYLGFALLIVTSATLLGLWFAERLARPVGRLAGAAQQIGTGDLDIRVKEERGSDEIALLSRAFNRMTAQLKRQRDALVAANHETEQRRHFIEAVLSGVTAGVIGLDADGKIDLMNDAAAEMLGLDPHAAMGQGLALTAPGFLPLLQAARRAPSGVARGEVREVVDGQTKEYLARIAPRAPDQPGLGFVLTLDDITALAAAQRQAAWGDIARRIAHEIKNPLTPIQLSADRMRRKFVTRLGDEGQGLEHLLDVITRQAGEIRRMVDEFSRFARMPEPKPEATDLSRIVRDAVLLQAEARPEIVYETDLPKGPVTLLADPGLIAQSLTNLLLNAAEAVEERRNRPGAEPGRIRVALGHGARGIELSIADNGIGLPKEGRDRLVDPYVTTRKKGTGLGLAIVRKIAEQHGGELVLGDARGEAGLDGALVTLRLPRSAPAAEGNGD